VNALGIADEGVVADRVDGAPIFAPYATFPVALAARHEPARHERARRVFATWLATMTSAPRMRGPYGIGESFAGDGAAIAPTLTWDGKILPFVAWMGGIVNETRRFLVRDGLYDRFRARVTGDYAKFEGIALRGTDLPLASPTRRVPRGMAGFRGR
jgi:hypothetical protein